LKARENFLDIAYQGLSDADFAKISIALRTVDYG
jgi:hypothetical protein